MTDQGAAHHPRSGIRNSPRLPFVAYFTPGDNQFIIREIEMRGLSTVLITVSPEASRQMRPPRALYPGGFKIGNSLGHPGQRELHRRVLRDALALVKGPPRPGEILERAYPEDLVSTSAA